MRRKDREMPEAFAWELADRCGWMTLAMTGPDGLPYCVPLSMAREGRRFYFHCAREGEKALRLRACPEVCVSCVGRAEPTSDFSVDYESAFFRGRAREVTDEEELLRALRLITWRWLPGCTEEAFREELRRALAATAVWAVEVTSATAKRRPGPAGRPCPAG